KFTTELREGIPEEVIGEYVKEHSPCLIVMGTRGAGKKEQEVVGSVTAEVLDSCRTLALTVPETSPMLSLSKTTNIVIFGNLDQEDILALDALHRILIDSTNPGERRFITMACVPGKKYICKSISDAHTNLLEYCQEHYPQYEFDIKILTLDDIFNDYTRMTSERTIDLIAVANKKRNVFSRLFNPALPHRLLFHFDIPMLVIPV
ncbi:MAG: universal stress protein, partial [Muribaculaceae bacterium]|nr:universal stress protein [Muribaculaceae bacterium]